MKFKEYLQETTNTSQFLTNMLEIRKWLQQNSISNYTIATNGVVTVRDNVILRDLDDDILKVKFDYVSGDFFCPFTNLKTLEGCPKRVDGDFKCNDNQLTSLVGSPEVVGGNFDCSSNQLTSLEHSPREIKAFNCSYNKLTNLKGGPKEVRASYNCYMNELTSLEGAPRTITGEFNCSFNKLTSLVGGPIKILNSYKCNDNYLTTLKGVPGRIGGVFKCTNNKLSSIDYYPEYISDIIDFSGNKIISLIGINDIITKINGTLEIDVSDLIEGGLGLIFIKLNRRILFNKVRDSDGTKAISIIQKYLGRPDKIFECQEELINAGLDAFAQL